MLFTFTGEVHSMLFSEVNLDVSRVMPKLPINGYDDIVETLCQDKTGVTELIEMISDLMAPTSYTLHQKETQA